MKIKKTIQLLKWRVSGGITKSYDPQKMKSTLAGPRTLQIQTIDGCNGSCPSCPYAYRQKRADPNPMDWDLYLKIINDINELSKFDRITFMFQNEPLLDPELDKRIRKAREILGEGVLLATVTNGALLPPSRTRSLFEAGLNVIKVSIDAYHEETYKAIRPGLDFERVIRNTHALIAYANGRGMAVRFLEQKANLKEQGLFKRYWERHGAEVEILRMSNRAGSIRDFETIRSHNMTWKKRIIQKIAGSSPCAIGPFEHLTVLRDGKVPLCCQDWESKVFLGDLSAEPMHRIWQGAMANHYRDLLWHGRFEASPLCNQCSENAFFPGK